MGSGGPGEGPTLLSHRPHPCCRLNTSPSLIEPGREKHRTPWGPGGAYFSHQLPPLTMHTSSQPQGLATAQQRTCPKDPLLPYL